MNRHPRPRAQKITLNQFKNLAYKQQLPNKEIASRFGVALSSIGSFRHRHNLPPRGWAKGNPPQLGYHPTPETIEKIASQLRGKPSWNKQERVYVSCKSCGKQFPTRPYLISIGKGKFCGKKCFDEFRKGKHGDKDFFKPGRQHPFYVTHKTVRTPQTVFGHRMKFAIAEKCKWQCTMCLKQFERAPIYKASKQGLRFDHVIPILAGGQNTITNGQLLCECCNKIKTSKDLVYSFNNHNFHW